MSCKNSNGKFRWFYSGNQVGYKNETGFFNFVSGGPEGSGISAGTLFKKFFSTGKNRAIWQSLDAKLSQKVLDAAWPFIELNWIAEIKITQDVTFYVSNRNIYVKDENGLPKFYEARASGGPTITISAGEWLSPNFQIGDVKLTLNNRDGFFNDYLPQGSKYVQWIGAEVKILIGFEEERTNYYEVFKGNIPPQRGVETTLEEVIVTAYDKFDNDQIEIPSMVYDKTNYPFVDTDKVGKPLPIIYGDYSEDTTSEYGDIGAICSNATDTNVISFVWNVSENALREIGDVYLHRGNRSEEQLGPIKFKNDVIVKEPEKGRVLVPANVPVLEEFYIIIENARPGIAGAVGQIISESSEQNFIKLGVNVGDTIYKEGDTTPYEVLSVGVGSLQTSIPTVMANENTYKVLTNKYTFRSGDKISMFLKGKNIENMSITRLADAGLASIDPLTLKIGLNGDYWTFDNTTKKIYNVSFDNKILKIINFSEISSEITFLTGLDIQSDNTLWLFDKNTSKIYRYILAENSLGLSFSTFQVSGLGVMLFNAGPLSINEGNILTLFNKDSGTFYRINPYGVQPSLVGSYLYTAFTSGTIDFVDIVNDVNLKQLLIMDRYSGKVFRVNELDGSFVSEISLINKVSSTFKQGRGVGYYIDGTIFLLNKQDLSIYNYNEFVGASENIGFIVRDILQKYVGKTTFDFDLKFNQTCRESLSQFKARFSINEKTKTITKINEVLQSFNCSLYLNFQKYSLFHIDFKNFRSDGLILREGDMRLNSFNPKKEFNQYFNSAYAKYKERPFSSNSISSDNYVSPTGVQLAGKEIKKELQLNSVYRREDIDYLVPLFVRLAAAEPEFVSVTVGFRFLFAQMNTFYNINFKDIFNPKEKSGRRFDNIPSFVREIKLNLDSLEIDFKLWSLGTTQFGNFKPIGIVGGGQNDQIILTNLGTAGYVAPTGIIISATENKTIIADSNGMNAESLETPTVGKAYSTGYILGLYNGLDHSLIEMIEIDQVSSSEITFKTNFLNTVLPTVLNEDGIIIDGHYLKYVDFYQAREEQKKNFCFFGNPTVGYPLTTSQEIEEQRAGLHNFENGRLPYVLYPFFYLPT